MKISDFTRMKPSDHRFNQAFCCFLHRTLTLSLSRFIHNAHNLIVLEKCPIFILQNKFLNPTDKKIAII